MNRINEKDLINKKYNRLTVLDAYRDVNNLIICTCSCECDKDKTIDILYRSLKSQQSTSCGCYRKEVVYRKSLNIANDLGFKFLGVNKVNEKYISIYKFRKSNLYLGYFFTEKEARRARILKELELLDEINEKLYKKIEINQRTVDYYLS